MGPLRDLLKSEQPWPLELVLDIADATIRVKTVVDVSMALDST